jgi:riboflavin transporter FmnP
MDHPKAAFAGTIAENVQTILTNVMVASPLFTWIVTLLNVAWRRVLNTVVFARISPAKN